MHMRQARAEPGFDPVQDPHHLAKAPLGVDAD